MTTRRATKRSAQRNGIRVRLTIFRGTFDSKQILWAFSIWLESVAILPQLFLLQRTGEAETITTHYLFALGAYRAFYIPNWIYRYVFDQHWAEHRGDPIAVVAGIIQTVLYSDFFWIYYTKWVLVFSSLLFSSPLSCNVSTGLSTSHSFPFPPSLHPPSSFLFTPALNQN